MKRKIALLLALVMVISMLPVFAPQKVSVATGDKFLTTFFSGGKVSAPTNPYLWFPYSNDHLLPNDPDISYEMFVVVDQPDDIVKYAREWNECYNAKEAKTTSSSAITSMKNTESQTLYIPFRLIYE